MSHRTATDARLLSTEDAEGQDAVNPRPEVLVRLLRDHVDARRKLAVLETEVDRIAQYHKPDPDALKAAMAYFCDYMGPQHHRVGHDRTHDPRTVLRTHDDDGAPARRRLDLPAAYRHRGRRSDQRDLPS